MSSATTPNKTLKLTWELVTAHASRDKLLRSMQLLVSGWRNFASRIIENVEVTDLWIRGAEGTEGFSTR